MPLDKIAFYGTGWQIHAEHLTAYLAGREPGDAGTRFAELVPPYQDWRPASASTAVSPLDQRKGCAARDSNPEPAG